MIYTSRLCGSKSILASNSHEILDATANMQRYTSHLVDIDEEIRARFYGPPISATAPRVTGKIERTHVSALCL